MCHFPIQGITLFVKGSQFTQRIGSLQQWAVTVPAGASPQIFRGRTQVNDPAAAFEEVAIGV